MNDRPHAGHCKIGLQVLVMVPAKRGYPVPRHDTELHKRNGQSLCPYGEIVIRIPVEAPVRKPRDDLLLAKQRFRPPQNGGKRELIFHHETSHVWESNKKALTRENFFI
jgi:hypothetical protein